MTENNIRSTNFLLGFFGTKGTVRTGLLLVYQYWCQHTLDKALQTEHWEQLILHRNPFSHSNLCYRYILCE